MAEAVITQVHAVHGPWELPEGWEWVPLGSLCKSIVGGGTPDRGNPKYWGGDIPWASVKDLRTDKLLTTQEFITLQGLKNSATKLVEPGTVIVATRMGLGKVCTAQTRIAINQDLKGLILSSKISAEYLTLFLRSCASEFERRGSGATVKGIKLEELRAWPVPLPFQYEAERSREIQHRIVARIETLLAEVKRARTLLEQIRRDVDIVLPSALAEVVKRLGKRSSESSTLYTLTSNGRLTITGGGTPSKNNKKYWNGNILWVSPKDMKTWYIDDSQDHISPIALEETAVKIIPKGSVLVVVRGMILAHTWPVSVTTSEVTINQDMKSLSPIGDILPEYLGYILRARASSILKEVEIAAHGTRRLKTDTLMQVTIPDVPKDVQKRVVAYLDTVQSSVGEMQQLLNQDEKLLDQLEQSMLERAFRGEL